MATISSTAAQSMSKVGQEGKGLDAEDAALLAEATDAEMAAEEVAATEKAEADKAPFTLPLAIHDNPAGWGPTSGVEGFGSVPFTPFSKSDKLGRASDWNSNWNRSRYQQSFADGASSTFAYKAEEDETTFSLVDSRPKPRRAGAAGGRGGGAFTRPRGGGGGRGRGRGRGGARRGVSNASRWGAGGRRGGWGPNPWANERPKESSVYVADDWTMLTELELSDLQYEYSEVPEAEDLTTAGWVDEYSRKFDKITPSSAQTLQTYAGRVVTPVGTLDDPVVAELARAGEGNVFASDVLLSVLMAAPRSVNPWDIVFCKRGGNVHVEKRSTSSVDNLTVNENWNEVVQVDEDSIDHPSNLSEEATSVNATFAQQVRLSSGRKDLERPHPYAKTLPSGAQPTTSGYRYRRFAVDDKIRLVVRCEVSAHLEGTDGETQFVAVKALNEFNSKMSGNVDWRRTLATQTGAVLATEMKNNQNKLGRFAAQALLDGVTYMKVGFVSRAHTKDNQHHVILKTQTFKPDQLAQQIKLKEVNMWGIVRLVVSRVLEESGDGDFVLLKDPNDPRLSLYRLPAGGLERANLPAPSND